MLTVLRIGHRAGRDKRMTTHCALTSRALGADKMIYTGDHDNDMEENVERVNSNWGGDFNIEHKNSWKSFLKENNSTIIYLSMYGIPYQEEVNEIKDSEKDKIIVIGGKKVPGNIYDYIDIQLAVTNQPHSEVAALAVFLENLQDIEQIGHDNAKLEVIPRRKGKEIKEKNK